VNNGALEEFSTSMNSNVVMAGLVPAIHDFHYSQDVDARHKAGHDGGEIGAS
jgi:hypothetical protein